MRWIVERLRGGVNRLSALFWFPLGPLRRLRQHSWQGARSCNLAIWRRDLDRVDGFDADYSGWGKEDSDIVVRLLRAGVRRKDGRFATGVIHLWHDEADRSSLADNERKLAGVAAGDRIRARQGLSAAAKHVFGHSRRELSNGRFGDVDQGEAAFVALVRGSLEWVRFAVLQSDVALLSTTPINCHRLVSNAPPQPAVHATGDSFGRKFD